MPPEVASRPHDKVAPGRWGGDPLGTGGGPRAAWANRGDSATNGTGNRAIGGPAEGGKN